MTFLALTKTRKKQAFHKKREKAQHANGLEVCRSSVCCVANATYGMCTKRQVKPFSFPAVFHFFIFPSSSFIFHF